MLCTLYLNLVLFLLMRTYLSGALDGSLKLRQRVLKGSNPHQSTVVLHVTFTLLQKEKRHEKGAK